MFRNWARSFKGFAGKYVLFVAELRSGHSPWRVEFLFSTRSYWNKDDETSQGQCALTKLRFCIIGMYSCHAFFGV